MMSPKILSLHALAFSSTVVLSLGLHSTPQQLRRSIVDTAALPKEDRVEVERELSESELPWYTTEEIKLNQEPCMSMNVEVEASIEDENTNLLTTEVPTESPTLQTLPLPDTLSPSTSTQQTIPPSTDEPQTLPPSNSVPQTGGLPSTLVPQTSSPTTSTPLTTLYPTPFVSRVVFRIPVSTDRSITNECINTLCFQLNPILSICAV